MVRLATAFVLCCLVSLPLLAQDTEPVDSLETDSALATPMDTLLYRPQLTITDVNSVSNPVNFEQRLTQNPTIALLKSAVVPGWGQVGNNRYIKAGVFAGFQAWFISAAIHYGSAASDYRDRWNDATDPIARNEWYGLYEDHRDDRNKYTWFAVINSFVAMFDAYVDAHLSGSPEKQRDRALSFDLVPDEQDGTRALLTYRF